jgi:cell division protein FtsQ
VFPLVRNARERAPDIETGPAGTADGGGLVLPRFLRRPVRHVMRLHSSGILYRPRTIAAAFLALALAGGTAYGVQTGLADRLIAQATAFAGFKIADIDINGLQEVSRIDILTNIDLGTERSLFSFDVFSARRSLRQLPWVSEARVSKAYPDRLVIDIVERVPFAVWQNKGELWLVERDGRMIAPFEDRFAGLPLVVGAGAAGNAAEFLAKLGRHPELAGIVKAHVRVGERRWNLVLESGVTVLLPEGREEEQLAELSRIDQEQALLARDISEIDMRLPDRMVVRLGEDAAERARAAQDPKKKPGKET